MPERTNMFINTQAQDHEIAGVYKDLDTNLLDLIKTNKIDPSQAEGTCANRLRCPKIMKNR